MQKAYLSFRFFILGPHLENTRKVDAYLTDL